MSLNRWTIDRVCPTRVVEIEGPSWWCFVARTARQQFFERQAGRVRPLLDTRPPRIGDQLTLTVEHRAAASVPGIALAVRGDGEALALRVIDAPPLLDAAQPLHSAEDRLAQALAEASQHRP